MGLSELQSIVHIKSCRMAQKLGS